MATIWNDTRYKFMQSGSKLGIILAINVAVFVIFNLPTYFGYQPLMAFANEYLALPASLSKLLYRPWTVITYMFVHAGFLHILFNMLWLYWFGQMFENYLGYKRTLLLYFLGGLAGAALFLAGYNLLPGFAGSSLLAASTVVGASASVMAVVVATATLLPDNRIHLMLIGAVPLKWVAMFLVIIDVVGVAGANAGGAMAHLGGVLIGFIYMKQLQRGNDWNKAVTSALSSKPKMKVIVGGAAERWRANSTVPKQDEIDRILDKISADGYDSLSKQDKETLKRASEHDH
ncbi:rhomboid family protein [Mucilaginibacter myungsuensis]|uniref:Rhomboid family intramembrane serine protease n=1 Tax=Mucilaginibacter myungsuensis TaxID=649104 RepID=A0A929L0E5_9SPHI|nr:rhomboid family intramembrane serine protease [Mucilaginibacter myungsuensis]MBE9663823.1 rhomboid family intramembrane serine protease [Mucilaginibacter myungsuensis]MDN3598462.1 rhomboid family intramembrane serine protease [Mucilaginibacter myungsuensis]